MLKILIVEDEPPLLRDISRMIQDISDSFHVVAEVTNAKQAIELIKIDSPDVLITDIHMPVINGLELIQWVRENDYQITPIILSGYEKFEYAHSAIAMDVAYYLLKPVKREKLQQILMKIENRVLKDRIYNCLFVTGSPTQTALNVSNSSYLLLMFCVGYYPANSYDDYLIRPQFWARKEIDRTISRQIPENCHKWFFNGNNPAVRFAVIQFTEKDQLNIQKIFDALSKEYVNHKFTLTIMISNVIQNIQDLRKLAKEMTGQLRSQIVLGQFRIVTDFNSEIIPGKPHKRIISSRQHYLLYKDINLGKKALVDLELSTIRENVRNFTYTQICVETALSEILHIFKYANAGIPDTVFEQLHSQLKKLAVVSLNRQMLDEQIGSLFQIILWEWDHTQNAEGIDYHDYMIQMVEEYILEHLYSTLNNKILSNYFGFSPAYLSKLFRMFKGISPIDYIATERIKKAKNILSESSSILIKEVASMVGFTDPYYFSKVFKKQTGLSPKDYLRKREADRI